jgi:hypothetical protein
VEKTYPQPKKNVDRDKNSLKTELFHTLIITKIKK